MRFLAFTLALAACSFSPDFGEGEFACGSGGICPEGYSCNPADNRCYTNGGPGIDAPADAPTDGSTPDAMCTPGDFLRCDGDTLVRCNATGDGEVPSSCQLGCNMEDQRCNVCMVGSMTCDSQGHVLTCVDGSGYIPGDCPDSGNACKLNLCQGAGQCMLENKPDSTPCATGICVGGTCSCGSEGQPCCASSTCSGGLACMNGTCGACGATTQPCCTGSMCAAGNLCSGSTCVHCGGASQPCCGGSSCDLGEVCSGSTCAPCGAQSQPCCTTGAACGSNLNCVNQTCQCASGTVLCNGRCVNTTTDPQNCGGCGADLSMGQTANTHNCAAGRTCSNSTCTSVCDPTETDCGFGGCANTQTDSNHCGSCQGCGFGAYCEMGNCTFSSCASGETRCTNNRSCTNLQFDNTNCGTCGNNCGTTSLCVAGMCKGFIYAAAAAECPASEPTFCSNAHTGNKGVCVAGTACP